MVRIYFATDIHGSELVWKKWLKAPDFYKAEIVFLSGDLTGKALIPLVEQPDGSYICQLYGREWRAKTEEEIKELEQKIAYSGYYSIKCIPSEVEEFKSSEERVRTIMEKLMIDRLENWLKLLEERLPKNITCFIMPGNDDVFAIDHVIKRYESENIICPLGKTLNLCYDFEMISLDYTNPTPWHTTREVSDEVIGKMVEERFEKVKDPRKTICNFHCPPFRTKLDLAPKLDKNLRPIIVLGILQKEHVGSKSIKEAFKKYQPLLGLHGHIHESYAADRIGKTLIINPGSEYTEGILRGFIIDLSERGVERYWRVEG